MQTTLRIDDETYREAKAEAARRGTTLTRYIEEALRAYADSESNSSVTASASAKQEIEQRNQLMEGLLQQTAGFRIGELPTREELYER